MENMLGTKPDAPGKKKERGQGGIAHLQSCPTNNQIDFKKASDRWSKGASPAFCSSGKKLQIQS